MILKRISSSCANLFSNARSRSLKVVMPVPCPSLREIGRAEALRNAHPRLALDEAPGRPVPRQTPLVQRHHDLADRAPVAERGDRLAAPFQREGRADLRRDPSLVPPPEQGFDVLGVALRVTGGERAPEYAAHVAALEQSEVERQLRYSGRE